MLLPIIIGTFALFYLIRFCGYLRAYFYYYPQRYKKKDEKENKLYNFITDLQKHAYTYHNIQEYIVLITIIVYFIYLSVSKIRFKFAWNTMYLSLFTISIIITSLVISILYALKYFFVRNGGVPNMFENALAKKVEILQKKGDTDMPLPPLFALLNANSPEKQIKIEEIEDNPDFIKYVIQYDRKIEKKYLTMHLIDSSNTMDNTIDPRKLLLKFPMFFARHYSFYLLPILCSLLSAAIFTKVHRLMAPDEKYNDTDMLIETFFIFLLGFLTLFYIFDCTGALDAVVLFGLSLKKLLTIVVFSSLIPTVIGLIIKNKYIKAISL